MSAPRRRAAAAIALVLVAAGCGSKSLSTTFSNAPPVRSSGPPRVAMRVLEFTPVAVQGRVGQVVTWTNEDSSPHNVTYVSGPRFQSSRTFAHGQRFSLRLTQAGTIHYFCSLHPWMKATIDVTS